MNLEFRTFTKIKKKTFETSNFSFYDKIRIFVDMFTFTGGDLINRNLSTKIRIFIENIKNLVSKILKTPKIKKKTLKK